MSRNIEIKARVTDMAALKQRARSVATNGPVEISQDDTFFSCDTGRLKLRKFSDNRGELIFYQRSDQPGPKESNYLRSETSHPDSLRQSLAMAWGETGHVSKHRTLYLAGRTRIHLDQVKGLGQFMELEVVLTDADSLEDGKAEAAALMQQLGIDDDQLVEGAYVDLLVRQQAGVPG